MSQPVILVSDAHKKKLPTVARELIFPEKVESDNTVILSSFSAHHMQIFDEEVKSVELS